VEENFGIKMNPIENNDEPRCLTMVNILTQLVFKLRIAQVF